MPIQKRRREKPITVAMIHYTELSIKKDKVILYLQDSKYKDRISDYFYYVALMAKRNNLQIKFDYCRTEVCAMAKVKLRRKKG